MKETHHEDDMNFIKMENYNPIVLVYYIIINIYSWIIIKLPIINASFFWLSKQA